ncbi:unnamed protein product [Mytilus edulis]|uniref:MULE transposase domain-containing protein n=1 Tax=Mytilus edulis TaxID=6550 RepID=A0A8S3VST7_MYTED|nr:unnamed protein product [Mytilus edulis]
MVEQLPTFPSLKSSLYRQREDLIPHLPTSLLNIDLQDEWTQTTEAERFLLINAGTYDKILVFATDNNLQHMAKNDNNTIYDDGTFCTCPSIFEQLYTLIDVPTGFCTITWESQSTSIPDSSHYLRLKTACTQLWNQYQTEGPRTTNHLEGWHSGLKKMIQVPHPTTEW